MKAAVLHHFGDIPRYEDLPDPEPQSEEEILVQVKAVALENIYQPGRAVITPVASFCRLTRHCGDRWHRHAR